MAENPHYRELLQLLNEFEVEYLIVGGFAVMKYGEPRYTKDLDVWVHNSPQNSLRVVEALKKFGAPLDHDGITGETFAGNCRSQPGGIRVWRAIAGRMAASASAAERGK
ncbi:MAG: hypothetical protein ABSE40_17145 [Candidatus Sulfotelmatobacter sp.]|jgi:hypothetical protein